MRAICTAVLILSAAVLHGQPAPGPRQWSDDVAFFARELPKRHANAFHRMTRETFDGEVRRLQEDLPKLAAHEIPVRLLQITAQIGDGHTAVRLPASFRVLPITMAFFGADLRVTAASRADADLYGGRITHIGGVEIAKVMERARTTLSAGENEWFDLANMPGALSRTETLHALGITAAPHEAEITVDTARGVVTRVLRGVARNELELAPPTGRVPLYRTRVNETFWFEPLAANGGGFYIAFRGYDDFGRHARALLSALDRLKPPFVVIDIRQNAGGDFTKPREQLIPGLKSRGFTGKRVFVITGRRTFSAAMVNAIDFRTDLGAMLIGEPPGERPNSYQENDAFTLPNSKLVVSYSTRYYKFLDRDADAVMPDRMVAPTWAGFLEGRDEPLEWLLENAARR